MKLPNKMNAKTVKFGFIVINSSDALAYLTHHLEERWAVPTESIEIHDTIADFLGDNCWPLRNFKVKLIVGTNEHQVTSCYAFCSPAQIGIVLLCYGVYLSCISHRYRFMSLSRMQKNGVQIKLGHKLKVCLFYMSCLFHILYDISA